MRSRPRPHAVRRSPRVSPFRVGDARANERLATREPVGHFLRRRVRRAHLGEGLPLFAHERDDGLRIGRRHDERVSPHREPRDRWPVRGVEPPIFERLADRFRRGLVAERLDPAAPRERVGARIAGETVRVVDRHRDRLRAAREQIVPESPRPKDGSDPRRGSRRGDRSRSRASSARARRARCRRP